MKKIPKISFIKYILKKLAHLFMGVCLLLLVHVWFTPSNGPNNFKNAIFRNQTMKM